MQQIHDRTLCCSILYRSVTYKSNHFQKITCERIPTSYYINIQPTLASLNSKLNATIPDIFSGKFVMCIV